MSDKEVDFHREVFYWLQRDLGSVFPWHRMASLTSPKYPNTSAAFSVLPYSILSIASSHLHFPMRPSNLPSTMTFGNASVLVWCSLYFSSLLLMVSAADSGRPVIELQSKLPWSWELRAWQLPPVPKVVEEACRWKKDIHAKACNLWNIWPSSPFTESYNLPSFQSEVNKLDLISRLTFSLSSIVGAMYWPPLAFPQHNSAKIYRWNGATPVALIFDPRWE